MSRLSTLAAFLLVALWLPATLHCRLESLDLSAWFACTNHADEDDHASQDSCADTLCQTVESGQVAFTKTRVHFAQPSLQACLGHLCLLLNQPLPVPREILSPHQEQTLPMQRTWQFVRRTALPVRAPSLTLA